MGRKFEFDAAHVYALVYSDLRPVTAWGKGRVAR